MARHGYHNRRRRRTQTRALERLEDEYADKQKDLNKSFTRAWSTNQRHFADERHQQIARHEIARRDLSNDHHLRLRDRRLAQEAEIDQLLRYPPYLMGSSYLFYTYEANKERHREENYYQQARHETEKQDLRDLHRQEIESMLLYHQWQERNLLMAHQQKMMDLWESFSLGRDRELEDWVRP